MCEAEGGAERLINLVEDFDWHREAEHGNKVAGLLAQAQELKGGLSTLTHAPNIEPKIAEAMQTIIDYLDDLYEHTQRNVNPPPRFPRRR